MTSHKSHDTLRRQRYKRFKAELHSYAGFIVPALGVAEIVVDEVLKSSAPLPPWVTPSVLGTLAIVSGVLHAYSGSKPNR